jgi:hypothetical protein
MRTISPAICDALRHPISAVARLEAFVPLRSSHLITKSERRPPGWLVANELSSALDQSRNAALVFV